MFGGGFAVGVAITRAEPAAAGGPGLAERPSRLGEVLPPSRRSDAEIAADLERMTAIEGALAAWRCQLVGELAARRPASADLSPIEVENGCGAPEGAVSEFFPDELARPADGSDPAVVAAVEAAVLPQAAGLSIRGLRLLARRELLARDAAAADRRREQATNLVNVT